MSKADDLKGKMSGTSRRGKTIGKKEVPQEKVETKKKVKLSKVPLSETTQINFRLPKKVHFFAKIVAMEEGQKLKDYVTDLIIDDLAKRGKM